MIVKRGQYGRSVAEVQSLLLAAGEELPRFGVDKNFGLETEAAVKSFQAKRKLPVTGVVDPSTLIALGMESNIHVSLSGFGNCGMFWEPLGFRNYLHVIPAPAWCKGVTLHHTAGPSLAQRPDGLTAQHMENIKYHYLKEREWKTGPHLFVDDIRINGLTPLQLPGTHAVSFNRTHIGIEVLGDYDSESPSTGRGLTCWMHAALVTADLLRWLDLGAEAVNFHRDDPRTSKTCPGRLVTREWFLNMVSGQL